MPYTKGDTDVILSIVVPPLCGRYTIRCSSV